MADASAVGLVDGGTVQGNPGPGDLDIARAIIQPGEQLLAIFRAPARMVKLQTRILCAIVLVLLAAIAVLVGIIYSFERTILYAAVMAGLGLIALLMCLSRHARSLAAERRGLYVVTDRMLYRQIGQHTASLPWHEVGSIRVGHTGDQTFAEVCPCLATKVVLTVSPSSGWANAHLDSAWCNGHCMQWQIRGETRTKRVIYVEHAEEARQVLDAARQASMGPSWAPVPAAAPAAAQSPMERIAGLKALLDTGAISQSEYDEKKTALLAAV